MACAASTTQTSFSDLNEDVIVNVLFFLIPTDILSVRKTYKTGYRASKHRSVWHAALTTLIHEHQLFAPTYDTDDTDDLPTAELERLASFPSLLLQRFSSTQHPQRNTYLPPTTQRVLLIPLSDDELTSQSLLPLTSPDLDTDVAHMTMIPGGRFLLTVSPTYPDGRTYMKLFDLGRPGCGSARVGLVAGFDADAMRVHATAPTKDGRGIRVVVQVFGNIIQVLEVYPLSRKPLFELVRSLEMPANSVIQFIDISGERVVCSVATPPLPGGQNPDASARRRTHGHILVWDYVVEKWAIVHTATYVHKECVLRGDSIVRLLNNELFVWKIPPLEESGDPIVQYDAQTTEPSSTHFLSFWNTRTVLPDTPMGCANAGWHTDPAAPQYLWTSQWDSSAEIAVYKLPSNDNDNANANNTTNDNANRALNRALSAPHVLAEFDYLTHHHHYVGPLYTAQMCYRENIVLQALAPGSVHFVRVRVPHASSDDAVEVGEKDMFALGMGHFVSENVQVCLATGRACALRVRSRYDSDAMDPPGEVRIFDYL